MPTGKSIMPRRRWTPAEDDAVRKAGTVDEVSRLAQEMGRTREAIMHRRCVIGASVDWRWTLAEDEALRDETKSNAQLAAELGRTEAACVLRRSALGIRSRGPRETPWRRWTLAEDEALRDETKSNAQLAAELGRTQKACAERRLNLGLHRAVPKREMPRRSWLGQLVRAANHTQDSLAAAMGRSQGNVGDWLSRRRPIPEDAVEQLAQLLSIDPWALDVWSRRIPRELEDLSPAVVAETLRARNVTRAP